MPLQYSIRPSTVAELTRSAGLTTPAATPKPAGSASASASASKAYSEMSSAERSQLKQRDPAAFERQRNAWLRSQGLAESSSQKPVSAATRLAAAGKSAIELYAAMSSAERMGLKRRSPAVFAELRNNWIAAGCPAA